MSFGILSIGLHSLDWVWDEITDQGLYFLTKKITEVIPFVAVFL